MEKKSCSDYLVCTCMGVMYSEICDAIKNGSDTYQALQDELMIGTGCSSCVEEVKQIVEEVKDDELRKNILDNISSQEINLKTELDIIEIIRSYIDWVNTKQGIKYWSKYASFCGGIKMKIETKNESKWYYLQQEN